jgi:phosphoribosylanthranilate isomerase
LTTRARPRYSPLAVRTRLKICCILDRAEVDLAIRHGADALGLVSQMPSGPGVIADAQIRDLAAAIPPGVASFLLTCREDPAALAAQQRHARANTLQLVDRVSLGTYAALRDALPGVGLVQVIHVGGPEALDEALSVAPHVDALLLDSGDQSLLIKELGGTGRVHDWSVSRTIREQSPVPVWLAGGLRPDNIRRAVDTVEPFGVDVCSGVRTDGRLDPARLAAFVAALA